MHKWPKVEIMEGGIDPNSLTTRAEHIDTILRDQGVKVQYIVVQIMYPVRTGTMYISPLRRWQFADTLDEVRELLSYWPESEVYRVGEQVKVDSAIHHHVLCNFSWHEGKGPCTCQEIA